MTVGQLRKQIEDLPDDTPCCYDLWFADDVTSEIDQSLPDDAQMTDEEVAETLASMFKYKDASIGLNWEVLRENVPERVQLRRL